MPRFIFWDCDNTLIDNADLHWRKHKETLATHGFLLSDEYRKPFYHTNPQQNWEWLVQNLGLDIPCDDYTRKVNAWYHEHIHELPLRSGISFALEHFRNRGARQCVVTNERRNTVEPMLRTEDISQYFDFLVCKGDYPGRKPEPTPYLRALDEMEALIGSRIDREDCLAIEDDLLGVTSAYKAGIKVIHRRHQKDSPASPDADISLFEESEFIEAILGL